MNAHYVIQACIGGGFLLLAVLRFIGLGRRWR